MNFQQFITILIARKRIIFRVFAFIVVVTTVISLVWPKSYKVETTVVLDIKNPDPVNGLLSQGLVLPSYLATQVDIVTSDRVARRVIKMLNFDKVPELVQDWKDAQNSMFSSGTGSFENYYAKLIQKKLDVKPSRESNVISIDYTAEDPKFAAAVANAFAKAYLETNIELTIDPAKQYTDWFQEQAKITRDKMEKEQATLSEMQKQSGIVSVDERLDVETNRLNELATQLTMFAAQKSDAQSRQNVAKGNIDTNPDVMSNPVIQNLRIAISTAESKLGQDEKTLGANHPQIKEERAGLDGFKARLQQEIANVNLSLISNAQINTQKEAELRVALDAQKKSVLDLKKQRTGVSDLEKELEATQLDYANIRQRLSQSSLQSQTPSASVTVLTPAYEPTEPSRPKILLNILLSIFMGGFVSVGVGMMSEIMDKRIRSADDIVEMDIPLLGVMKVVRKSQKNWRFWRRQKVTA